MRLVITVPMAPNVANSRQHWRVKLKTKHAYFAALDTLQAAKQIPAPPTTPIARASLDVVMHLANRMDHDNAAARCKFPLDWLKTRGYIVDDSPKCLEWVSFPEQRVKRDGNYRITFTLSPLSRSA